MRCADARTTIELSEGPHDPNQVSCFPEIRVQHGQLMQGPVEAFPISGVGWAGGVGLRRN